MSAASGLGPAASRAELDQIVAAADTGAREPGGLAGRLIFGVGLAWSLFQLWYASPLPYMVGRFIFNDTEARSIHLAFAIFLLFLGYPFTTRSPRDRVPAYDRVLASLSTLAAAYLLLAYRDLATRPGLPTPLDYMAAVAGVVLLLEATRRSQGPWLSIISLGFLLYCFAGPWMPDIVAHKGASIGRVASHMWLTTEGVYGVALGVSTTVIFLYVLFGALLDKAGGGNYMMQISFALLGHLRGGPAKVAVVSSALNGIISGSSVSNVVTGGVFTIPMMKRTGLSAVKAGAIETSSSINGQIMPPVMGAAAFLMTEYVGIPYDQVVKHAALPAIISYVALFYIVHLEAVKMNIAGLPRAVRRPWPERIFRLATGLMATLIVSLVVIYGTDLARRAAGDQAPVVLGAALLAAYVAALWYASRFPDLALDDPSSPVLVMPETWPTVRTGLHFLLPVAVLLYCLMVEGMSPGLSAFWATAGLIVILLTQRPLVAVFRGQRALWPHVRQGSVELVEGLVLAARNMTAIAVACGVAGIIVGSVTLTGMGLMMTDLVELISAGSVMAMLVLTAGMCLILGLGVPTTASYIVIATLIAPVIVELGAQNGLVIPLIAVHLFVFYFGIIADVTPPVGLAAFAAAAISGADPTRTGWQGTVYSMRTAILPFLFVYNPQLVLVDIDGWLHGALVAAGAVVAMMLFAAVSMNFFLTRNRWWEALLLVFALFTLFRPGFWLDRLYPPFREAEAARLLEIAGRVPPDGRLVITIEGDTVEREGLRKSVSLRLPGGPSVEARLAETGATLGRIGEEVIVTGVRLRSYADKAGLEQGFKVVSVRERTDRPSPYLFYIPAVLALGVVIVSQRRRLPPAPVLGQPGAVAATG